MAGTKMLDCRQAETRGIEASMARNLSTSRRQTHTDWREYGRHTTQCSDDPFRARVEGRVWLARALRLGPLHGREGRASRRRGDIPLVREHAHARVGTLEGWAIRMSAGVVGVVRGARSGWVVARTNWCIAGMGVGAIAA